jgi:hypothetical protein
MAKGKRRSFNTQLAEERKKIQQETEQAIRKNISTILKINCATRTK